MKDYILITPCKNEEKNIHRLVNSIKNQSIKPKLWVIVNDGSTDKTLQLLSKFKQRWIKVITLKPHKRDMGLHLSKVHRLGFKNATSIANKNKIRYSHIGLVDADIFLEKRYFEKLIKQIKKNNYGIVSGGIYSKIKGKYVYESQYSNPNLPRGGARLWKKECFDETGGYIPAYSSDSVSNIKAKINCWKMAQLKQVKAYQIRPTDTAEGLWKGNVYRGKSAYFLHIPFYFVILKSIKKSIKESPSNAAAYLSGYLSSLIKKEQKLKDKDIKKYNSKILIRRILNAI